MNNAIENLPLVTVFVPAYNHEKYIKDCINSIINQTYSEIELIIINDGSLDNTHKMIMELTESCQIRFSGFHYINREKDNKGLSASINQALDMARGKYFCTLASDDSILPEKVALQVDFMEMNPWCSALFGGVNLISDSNAVIGKCEFKSSEVRFNDLILQKISPMAASQMLRKSDISAVGKYDPEVRIEDWYMWLKLTSNGRRIYVLNEILSNYRVHESNSIKNVPLMSAERKKILDKYANLEIYNEAISVANMKNAFSVRRFSKLYFMDYMWKSFSASPSVFFTLIASKVRNFIFNKA